MDRKSAIDETTAMLNEYQSMQRQIMALRYRMKHPNRVTDEELISQMSMPGKSDFIGGSVPGRISDKTMYIALNYEDQAIRMNQEEVTRIAEKLLHLEDRKHRLDYHIELLPPQLSHALKSHYIDGLTWREIATAENISLKTMEIRRVKAIDMLAELLFLDECSEW